MFHAVLRRHDARDRIKHLFFVEVEELRSCKDDDYLNFQHPNLRDLILSILTLPRVIQWAIAILFS